jgi:ribonuclease HII
MKELILGIDDAGRGPVIGPMILAGCLIEKKQERYLKKIGVKDSKDITQKRREFLEKKIKTKAISFKTEIISPKEIDRKNKKRTKLNELEAEHFATIINKINNDNKSQINHSNNYKIKVIIDCPSPNISKWCDFLKTKIENLENLEIHCEHKADKNHVAVSAASILAKCVREKEIKKLKEKFGEEIGSGYCSDPLTMRFLDKFAAKHKDAGLFRKTWITWKKAFDKLNQQTLDF